MKNFFKIILPVFAFAYIWFLLSAKGLCASSGDIYTTSDGWQFRRAYSDSKIYLVDMNNGKYAYCEIAFYDDYFRCGGYYTRIGSTSWNGTFQQYAYPHKPDNYYGSFAFDDTSFADVILSYSDFANLIIGAKPVDNVFDDTITLGRFFYTRIDFFGVLLSDKYYIWWGLGNSVNVKIEYYNVLTEEIYDTFTRTNSPILQYSVFNPTDYNISDNTYVGVRITPLDVNGNYGVTDSIHFIAHSDIVISEDWSDSPYIEPVLDVNGLDDVRPYINKYTVTTTIPNLPSVPKEQYSPGYVVDVDTTEIERLLQYIIDNMNNNVSDNPQQIIINTPVIYEPVDIEFDTPTFKNDFKTWKNGVVDYLMQFNGTPFGEPFAHLVTVILILSGLALALLIIKRL